MNNSTLKKVAPCLYKYEASGVYFAHVRSGGKLHRKSLGTTDRKLANRFLTDFRRKLSRIDPGLSKTTLAAMADVYLQTIEHMSASTKKARRGSINSTDMALIRARTSSKLSVWLAWAKRKQRG